MWDYITYKLLFYNLAHESGHVYNDMSVAVDIFGLSKKQICWNVVLYQFVNINVKEGPLDEYKYTKIYVSSFKKNFSLTT